MLRLRHIILLSILCFIISKHACDANVSNEISLLALINRKTLEDNNVIPSVKSQTRSFTSYVPQCWSYLNYVPFGRNAHFKSHFNVVISRGGQFKVEYERGETCGVVTIVCLRPIPDKRLSLNDPEIRIDTCGRNKVTTFSISSDTAECIPAVQCQKKALYNTKMILTLSGNDYRPLSVFSLNGGERQYNGTALAEGRRTQALLTEHDVREYRERADALHYASDVDSVLDEYDHMAGIDKSQYKCLEIQAWRSGPNGAPAADLPICPTVFLRAKWNTGYAGYKQFNYLVVDSNKGLISGGFLTRNPATSWVLLHETAHVYDAYTTDNHLHHDLHDVSNNVLAGMYQARYGSERYWLYNDDEENTLEVLRPDVAFGDLNLQERAHVFIGLLNVDDDSSYIADLYRRYYSSDRVTHVLEELVSMYLNRRVDPLPLMARVFSAERGNWFNITQFAQAISLSRRLSYDKNLNTFPKSVFSVTSAPVNLKTNVSFSPEDCDTPYFTIDGISYNKTTVVSRANSLVECLDTPIIGRSITNLTKFIYLTDINVKENIVVNPALVMANEGLKFLGYSNTWGHLDFRLQANELVFETYNMQPHSLFDTVYAHFTFLNDNDEVIWHVSIKGTERQKRFKVLNLSDVNKIKIYYIEPYKLKFTRTNVALSRNKYSTFIINSPENIRNNIEFKPLHIMSNEALLFNGYGNTWGSLYLHYDINKLVFKTHDMQPHSLFDTVYAEFTFFNYNDEVMWQVSIKGTERQKRYKELNLSEMKKIQIYYAEPEKLKNSRTKEAISENMTNMTLFNRPGCGFAETVEGRLDHFQRDVKHFVSAPYLLKFVELFKQSCVHHL